MISLSAFPEQFRLDSDYRLSWFNSFLILVGLSLGLWCSFNSTYSCFLITSFLSFRRSYLGSCRIFFIRTLKTPSGLWSNCKSAFGYVLTEEYVFLYRLLTNRYNRSGFWICFPPYPSMTFKCTTSLGAAGKRYSLWWVYVLLQTHSAAPSAHFFLPDPMVLCFSRAPTFALKSFVTIVRFYLKSFRSSAVICA